MEILKNQLEAVNTETELIKAQQDKEKKTFSCLKMAYNRLKSENEYFRKGKKQGKRQKSQLAQTPMQTPNGQPQPTSDNKNSTLLDISGASAFQIAPNAEHSFSQMRFSIGPSQMNQSDMGGQSLMPFLSVETKDVEAQCDLWTLADILKN